MLLSKMFLELWAHCFSIEQCKEILADSGYDVPEHIIIAQLKRCGEQYHSYNLAVSLLPHASSYL